MEKIRNNEDKKNWINKYAGELLNNIEYLYYIGFYCGNCIHYDLGKCNALKKQIEQSHYCNVWKANFNGNNTIEF